MMYIFDEIGRRFSYLVAAILGGTFITIILIGAFIVGWAIFGPLIAIILLIILIAAIRR